MDRLGDRTREEDEMRSRHAVFGRLFAALVALFALGIFAVTPAAAADGDTLELDLEGLNDFDFEGTALITEENGAITVEIETSGDDVVGAHPVHIHLGTCNELDPNPTYSLADIDEDGNSTTLVDGVTLDDLLAEDHAINAHVSATDIPTYTTCGNIALAVGGGDPDADEGDEDAAPAPADDEDEADDAAAAPADDEDDDDTAAAPAAAVNAAPSTGVGGTLGGDAGMSAFLTMLGSLAVVLAAAGVTLRVREERARR